MSIIDKFGELVKSRIVEHPGSANDLLYCGYYADYIKNKFTKGSTSASLIWSGGYEPGNKSGNEALGNDRARQCVFSL